MDISEIMLNKQQADDKNVVNNALLYTNITVLLRTRTIQSLCNTVCNSRFLYATIIFVFIVLFLVNNEAVNSRLWVTSINYLYGTI